MDALQRPDNRTGATDRRRRIRYAFTTIVGYLVLKHGSASLRGRGRTLNMSTDGMLVELGEHAPPNCRVELTLDWPGLYHGAERVQLIVEGRVLRADGRIAAVAIISSAFRTSGPAAAGSERRRAVA